jgi:hypothetical protein
LEETYTNCHGGLAQPFAIAPHRVAPSLSRVLCETGWDYRSNGDPAFAKIGRKGRATYKSGPGHQWRTLGCHKPGKFMVVCTPLRHRQPQQTPPKFGHLADWKRLGNPSGYLLIQDDRDQYERHSGTCLFVPNLCRGQFCAESKPTCIRRDVLVLCPFDIPLPFGIGFDLNHNVS